MTMCMVGLLIRKPWLGVGPLHLQSSLGGAGEAAGEGLDGYTLKPQT